MQTHAAFFLLNSYSYLAYKARTIARCTRVRRLAKPYYSSSW